MIPEGKSGIAHLFNKFAGREVLAPMAMGIDPTIQEMKKVAEDNGYKLRIWYPGSRGTMDHQPNRVNVHIEEGVDGKFRVGKKFNLG